MGSNQHGVCVGCTSVWTKFCHSGDHKEKLIGVDFVRYLQSIIRFNVRKPIELILVYKKNKMSSMGFRINACLLDDFFFA